MNIVTQHILGRPGPVMAIEIAVTLGWQREPAFLLGLRGQASFNSKVLSDDVQFERGYWLGSDSTLMARDGNSYQGKLVIPLRSEAIRYIEENRHDQDVSLSVQLQYTWQEVIEVPAKDNVPARKWAGAAHGDTTGVQGSVIKRSDWLKRLAEMGWQEYELFEVARLPLLADQNLAVALKRLEEAQVALRTGDYSGVFVKCRAAFESAARYESSGDTRRGFEALLARAFKEDSNKQETINNAIRSISEYAHLARHEQYPAVHFGREEAEFVYCATVSAFSMISRRLVLRPTEN